MLLQFDAFAFDLLATSIGGLKMQTGEQTNKGIQMFPLLHFIGQEVESLALFWTVNAIRFQGIVFLMLL